MTQFMHAVLTAQEIEIEKYYKRKQDFESLSTNMMISLKIQKDDGLLTSDQLFEIETAFEKVEIAGGKGRWKTALHELNKIGLTVAVTQELIDSIKVVIESYILESYD